MNNGTNINKQFSHAEKKILASFFQITPANPILSAVNATSQASLTLIWI